jgi:hypothetical protein
MGKRRKRFFRYRASFPPADRSLEELPSEIFLVVLAACRGAWLRPGAG